MFMPSTQSYICGLLLTAILEKRKRNGKITIEGDHHGDPDQDHDERKRRGKDPDPDLDPDLMIKGKYIHTGCCFNSFLC